MLQIAVLWMAFVLWTPQGSAVSENYDQAFARGFAALTEGRVDEGIEAYHKCLELRPKNGLAAYNLACGHSRKGDVDAAMDWLGKSAEWGHFTNPGELAWALQDEDLIPLHGDPRFKRVLDEVQKSREAIWFPTLPASYIDWSGSHRRLVSWGRFSPDGSRIVTASGDGSARVFDSETGEQLLILDGHSRLLSRCAFSPDGERILTAGQDWTVRLWDARTGEPLGILPIPDGRTTAVSFSPDGDRILVAGDRRASIFKTVLGTPCLSTSLRYPSVCYDVSFDMGGEQLVMAGADGVIRFHDSRSGDLLRSFAVGPPVFAIDLHPGGKEVAAACADGRTRLYEKDSGRLLRTFEGHRAEVNQLDYDPSGSRLATSSVDRTVRVWDVASGKCEHVLSGFSDEVYAVCFSPDGRRVLGTSADSTAAIWDADSGERLLRLESLINVERQLEFSADGTRLITLDTNAVREWDALSGEELQPRDAPRTVRFRVARQGSPQSLICLTPHPSQSEASASTIELVGAGIGVDAVFVSRDARSVYSADMDGVGRLWNGATGQLVKVLGRLTTDPEFNRDTSRLKSAAFSSDGQWLATAQHADGAARVWDAHTGDELEVWRGGTAAFVLWADSKELLAVGRGTSVEIRDLTAPDPLAKLTGHLNRIQGAAFGPGARTLATCSMDGSVRLWDLERNECIRVFQPLPSTYFGHVALSGDGNRVAGACSDKRVFVWNTESDRLLGTIVPGDEPGDWLAFAPGSHYHGTSAAIARARLVQGAISYPLSCFAAALESPEKVKASFAGLQVEMPKLSAPPSLVVAAPVEHFATVHERAVRIQALATDALAGLEIIEVLQDGSSVSAELLAKSQSLENNERLARLDLLLPIPSGASETKISLQAVSTRGIKSRPERFVVRYEPPKRELYLMALGVADYDDDALDLRYPVRDVDDLIARLQAQAGELYHQVHVERRVNREVTNAEALRLRDEFLLQARPDDTIVVFAAGHGVRSASSEYWFLTSSATPAKPYGGIDRHVLESLVTWDKLHASRRVLLIDTCHAGTAFEGARGERGLAAFRQDEVDAALERSSGLYIFAATSDDAFAREQEGNGIFTRAILDGLAGAADVGSFGDKDGYVGVSELMQFARYAVLEKSAGRQVPTFPRIEGGENFPLARARALEGTRR